MARGWESKSVEGQQAEAAEEPPKTHKKLSASEAARVRETEALQMARARILQQLKSDPVAGYRSLLERSLEDLEDKLQKLSRPM